MSTLAKEGDTAGLAPASTTAPTQQVGRRRVVRLALGSVALLVGLASYGTLRVLKRATGSDLVARYVVRYFEATHGPGHRT